VPEQNKRYLASGLWKNEGVHCIQESNLFATGNSFDLSEVRQTISNL
jgi:hypothetical protein